MLKNKRRILWIAIFVLSGILTTSLFMMNKNDTLKACELLTIALDESGDLAPAWYSAAGQVIGKCGNAKAPLYGDYKACLASRRDDTSISCDKEEAELNN